MQAIRGAKKDRECATSTHQDMARVISLDGVRALPGQSWLIQIRVKGTHVARAIGYDTVVVVVVVLVVLLSLGWGIVSMDRGASRQQSLI